MALQKLVVFLAPELMIIYQIFTSLILENKVNQTDLDDMREDVKKLDMLNVILKRKLENQERVVTRDERGGEVEVSPVNNNFMELQDTCRKLSERNEAGFSRLTFLSQVYLLLFL